MLYHIKISIEVVYQDAKVNSNLPATLQIFTAFITLLDTLTINIAGKQHVKNHSYQKFVELTRYFIYLKSSAQDQQDGYYIIRNHVVKVNIEEFGFYVLIAKETEDFQ